MEQLGKKHKGKVEEVCPVCGMPQSEWPVPGVLADGTLYCCEGCRHGTGCTCRRGSRMTGDRPITRLPS